MFLGMMLWGCTNSEEAPQGTFVVDISDYHGMYEGATWVYRDDGIVDLDDLPDEDQLLRAMHMGDGVVEFRRGRRWADSQSIGEMVWDIDNGLTLLSWDLPFGQGEGEYPISNLLPEDEPDVTNGEWTCVNTMTEAVETWYGTFDNVLLFECDGGPLAGEFAFGKNFGLVHLQTADVLWSMVF